MIRHELWVHAHLTDVIAVRLIFGQVVGVCRLSFSEAVNEDLLTLIYDGREEAIARARDRPEQFGQFEPWLSGRWVPARRRWRQPRYQHRQSGAPRSAGALP
jgi:hypothetical protein